MDDWPRLQLRQLAPTIDEVESKRLFDRRREIDARRRTPWLVAAAIVVLVGAGSLVLVGRAGTERRGDTGGLPELDEPSFEIISRGSERTNERMLAAATTVDELADLLVDQGGFVGDAASVDFRRQIVVALPVPPGLCPPELVGFRVDGRSLTPGFVDGGGPCPPPSTAPMPEPRFHTTLFVALERAGLSPSFTLRPTPEQVGDTDVAPLEVSVLAADTVPAQPEFEVLAEQNNADRPGELRSAVNADELDALWAAARVGGDPPDVDFADRIVVSFSTYAGSCNEVFDGFDVHEQVWTPRFVDQPPPEDQPTEVDGRPVAQVCARAASARTYIVGVDRAAAAPGITLRLLDSHLENPPGERRLQIDVPSPADAATGQGTARFEVLDVQEAPDMGVLRSAVDADELHQLWTDASLRGQPPDVDFRRSVVVSIGIPDDACPPILTGFDVDEATWTPVFVEPGGACRLPLIPKTYVVALDRRQLGARFTLQLPEEGIYDLEEQHLEVDVPPSGEAPPTTEVTPVPTNGPEWSLPLPERGDAESRLAPDGTPLWIVHHDDGTASALPAVTAVGNSFGNEFLPVDQAATVVRWSPQSRTFHGSVTYDEYGRALNSGRDDDLADYLAVIDGNDVIVRPSDGDRVPGEPIRPVDGPRGGQAVEPELPDLVPVPDELPRGWSSIDGTLVSTDDTWRICAVGSPDGPLDQLDRCDSNPFIPPGLLGGHTGGGGASWYFGPLVVHVADDGEIDLITNMGGLAGMTDE